MLLSERRLLREEIVNNIGFEHGSIAGTTKTLSRLRQEPPDTEYHLLAGELRKKIALSRIPLHMHIPALLETAWSLSFDLGKAG